jgi:prepilin-type N-terminal cleavage/methylation domain-containing protein
MKGFTLIEVLVVASITVIMAGLLIANFSRTRVDMNQTTLTVKDAIREAQSLALTGAVFGTGAGGAPSHCGFGIHFESDGYTIYAGPLSDPGAAPSGPAVATCVASNYGFANNAGIVRTGLLSNSVLEIVLPQSDIFFEPPDPKTYFIPAVGKTTTVTIRQKGTSVCPSADCRQIDVNSSGQIQ